MQCLVAKSLTNRGLVSKRGVAGSLVVFKAVRSSSRCMATNSAGTRATTRSQAGTSSPAERTNNAAGSSASASPDDYTPLRVVVKDAVKRWFNEAQKEAAKGDIKQQALLGQMMIEGYGCKPNPDSGREWTERARKRGYKMAGVYCEI